MSGPLTVASNGLLQVTGGITFPAPITNAGTVVWTGGATWYMRAPFENLSGALFDWQGDGSLYHDQTGWWFDNAGTFRKSAGSGWGYMSMPFRNTGTVQGQSGTLQFYYTCQNSSTMESLAGLVLFNAYSETSSANLAVSLGGTAPSAYGHLDFVNAPTFIGQFTVRTHNGFRPNAGDAFVVLSYPSATVRFICLNGLDLGGGILLLPEFRPTKLTLTATAYTPGPLPQLFVSRAPGGVRITWPLGFPGWKLLSTTNLTSPVWVELPVQCGNQALVPWSGPMAFFRLVQ